MGALDVPALLGREGVEGKSEPLAKAKLRKTGVDRGLHPTLKAGSVYVQDITREWLQVTLHEK